MKVSLEENIKHSNEVLRTKIQASYRKVALDTEQHRHISQENNFNQRRTDVEKLREKDAKAKEESIRLEEIHCMRQEDKRSSEAMRFIEECK
eukprot:9078611-Ditylum_brightwellii.AAC.1